MTQLPPRIPRLGWVLAFLAVTTVLGLAWINLKSTRPDDEALRPVIANVPDFSFTSQSGQTVTRADLAGKIWVADFIFTRCPGPCPVMTARMAELQSALARVGGDDVRLVSVTVDPEYDTPEVLTAYGERFGANPALWYFLTGDSQKIDDFAVKGMLQPLMRDPDGVPNHSQKFVVVDGEGRIRTFYDLDDRELIPKLLMDIGALVRERNRGAQPASTPAG